MNSNSQISRQRNVESRQNGDFQDPSDRVLAEISRKATLLEQKTRNLEAENTKLRHEHTKALLAAAQAQDALNEFHASTSDTLPHPAPFTEPRPQQTPPREPSPREPMARATERPPARDASSAFGSLTVAACLIAMTVNYAILLRYTLVPWLAGLGYLSF